jgi:uncharacterized protein YbjT (DUF2867 family)
MKTALVAGATGLVGKELINELIADNNYQKVIVLTRRQLQVSHAKVEVILVDFDQLDGLMLPEKIDECFCSLGTTQKKSGKKGLYQVDFEYVVRLAQLCKRNNIPKFLVVSSQGANPDSAFFYMQTKGRMEEAVKTSEIETVYIVRPSLITGKREEVRFAEVVGYYMYKVFTPLMIGKLRKLRPVSGHQIAKSMIALAQKSEKGDFTIESDFIQKY